MVDISTKAVETALSELWLNPQSVEKFVEVQETCRALSARVSELEAKQATPAGMDPDTISEWRQRVRVEAIDDLLNPSDVAVFKMVEEIRHQSDGMWEPSIPGSWKIAEALIKALKENGK
jgi:hypothetical protein